MTDPITITFRKLQLEDLALLQAWLNNPQVSRWYGTGDYTFDQVFQKYEPRINGETPTQPFLILHSGEPIGYIQTYRISDYPDYNLHVGADEHTAGVDLFIGETGFTRRGVGTAALRTFLLEVVFSDEEILTCLVGPEPDNRAAIRCYEKAGFRYLKTIQIPGEPHPEFLMQIGRKAAQKG